MLPFRSRLALLPLDNVDTDQIIPARFLKTTDKAGLGASCFADWRYDERGQPRPDFVLNRPEVEGAKVLVAGDNFGCGSSREHAPWALLGCGFRAIISTHFADIFRTNALKNGLLPITVDPAAHMRIAAIASDPAAEVTVDLASQSVTLPGGDVILFPVDPFAKHCLLHGIDQLGFLLATAPAIDVYEGAHPARVRTG